MCGIVGALHVDGFMPEALRQALTAIRHRGPDSQGEFSTHRVALGMRRLAVIDVAGGQQPVFNEDRTIAVVFNGEIYNYRELLADLRKRGHVFRSESDTETLVHLYEEWGSDMCSRLRGMFAFAIWDETQGRLLLARDRFGKKPLYLSRFGNDGIVFASELKALRPLLQAAAIPERINQRAIYDYLSLGCIPQPAVRSPAGGGIHSAGTVPMGEGPARCNAEGRTNLLNNVYVADGAAVPSLPSKSITMSLAAHELPAPILVDFIITIKVSVSV
jgi:asparagine synthase (glutamine-hydrolysing)